MGEIKTRRCDGVNVFHPPRIRRTVLLQRAALSTRLCVASTNEVQWDDLYQRKGCNGPRLRCHSNFGWGGLPSSLYEPPIYVRQRCDDAAAIRGDSDVPILTLSAGSAHLPQLLSKDGMPVWESTASAAYLQKKHHIESNVYLETTAYDTIGNAFFARTSQFKTDFTRIKRIKNVRKTLNVLLGLNRHSRIPI